MNQKYSILIPSKTMSNLQANIKALMKARVKGRIIILDDFDELTREFDAPGLEWIKCPKPFNFARNINIGIAAAGHDDVILLNDDALLESPGGFDLLHEEMHRGEDTGVYFGAVSCLISGMAAAPDQCYNVNRPIHNWIRRIHRHMIAFMAVYIPRTVINQVGLLDERFVGYGYEDDDYCRRLIKSGWSLGVFDGAIVEHNLTLPSTFRGNIPAGFDLLAQNRAIFEAKWERQL